MSLPGGLALTTFATVHTTQLHAEDALHLAQNLRVGNGFATLVVLNHRRLLVDLHRKVLLSHTFGLARLANCLSDRGRHFAGRSHIILTVQLSNALVIRALMALVMTCSNFIG